MTERLIESEGLLYRGTDLANPAEIWDYPRRQWVAFHGGPFVGAPGRKIGADEAEQLKVNNPAAEHFLYYDDPPWRQPLSQAYRDTLTPQHVKDTIRKRQALLGKTGAE